MSKALIPIKVIAENIAQELGDSTGKLVFSITRHLLSGWRELNLYNNHDFEVKTAVLEIDNVIPMPCDFVYETKVALRNKETGKIAVLTLDKSIQKEALTQLKSENYLQDIFYGNYTGASFTFYNAYRNGFYLGELYGFGRGVLTNGFYNIDKKTGEIYIGSLVPDNCELVIEYKSDGISDGLKLVPSETEMCLTYWALSRYWQSKRQYNDFKINQIEYFRHYNKLKRLYNFRDDLYLSAEINKHFSPTNY